MTPLHLPPALPDGLERFSKEQLITMLRATQRTRQNMFTMYELLWSQSEELMTRINRVLEKVHHGQPR